jgi:hypothetical protein
MSLAHRIARIEGAQSVDSVAVHVEVVTDEELALKADSFERQLAAGELPPEFDPASVRQFVHSVRSGGMVHAYRTR